MFEAIPRALQNEAIFHAALIYFVVSSAAVARDADKGFITENIVHYQPDDALRERHPDGDVTGLADYIKQIQAVCTDFFAATAKSENFTIVVAIRPGKRSRVWFISSTLPAKDSSRDRLHKRLGAISPCDVRHGPVAFAIVAKLAGGSGKIPGASDNDFSPPIPKEWSDARLPENPGPLPDCFIDVIWPDKQ